MMFYGFVTEFGSEFNSVYGTEQTVEYACILIFSDMKMAV